MKARSLATTLAAAALAAMLALSCGGIDIGTGLRGNGPSGRIIDHRAATIEGITASRVARAKETLVVAYWHTSHGSQLVTGIEGMDAFFSSRGWNAGTFTLNGAGGLALSEPDVDVGGFDNGDLDNSIEMFEQSVRGYLAANPSTNVVMASWCGQVSGASEASISHYLETMSGMEDDFPGVTFVYMTGHSDGSGIAGNLHLRDRQIRDYCVANGKWLYDFYDIECYDPDGVYYGDRFVTDGCNYDANGIDGTTQAGDPAEPNGGDRNWATDWQNAHAGQWWSCSAAHSKPLNGNQKAKAAWQLWCAIADGM